jgi:hypothetical protein
VGLTREKGIWIERVKGGWIVVGTYGNDEGIQLSVKYPTATQARAKRRRLMNTTLKGTPLKKKKKIKSEQQTVEFFRTKNE